MHIEVGETGSKKNFYDALAARAAETFDADDDLVSTLANASALLWLLLDDINWAGFYLARGDRLVLGPFQGKPAVTEIKFGSGVCGTAYSARETQVVSDVHKCDNHIACDPDSSSEIVVPMIWGGEVVGVLDIDSPTPSRFDDDDRRGLEKFVEILLRAWS